MQNDIIIWSDADRLSHWNYLLSWIGVGLTFVGIVIAVILNPAVSCIGQIAVGLAFLGVAVQSASILVRKKVDKLSKRKSERQQRQIDRIRFGAGGAMGYED